MKCENCRKEIEGDNVQYNDPKDFTTVHVFCSEECKEEWIKNNK
ncbi:MAG: hypothetical protein ACOC44_08400 [Promethearchaeia archaeon]